MTKKDANSPKPEVTFKCLDCRYTFRAPPVRVEDEPSRAHPYRYFANCPDCHREVQQVNWEVGVFSSVLASTGPTTPEGKAASASNLAGHPSVQSSKLTRYNALKHGAYAKTAMFFPARPGKYPQCKTCDVDFEYCATQPACIKRTELVMQHLLAFESGDPSTLLNLQAVNQANLSAIFSDMIQQIAADGVALKNPVYGFDKEGGFHIGQYRDPDTGQDIVLEEVKSHPLLKPLMDMLSKNNLSMADLNMTPKVQVDQGIQMGQLNDEDADKEKMLEYQQRMSSNLDQLRDQISRSRARVSQDSVLSEYMQDEAEEGEFIEVKADDSPER
ncbi:hypothetical protein HMF8227_02377 [Saliniradius amylolyticus]|uniref:Uncharacterized protein n=1 Tax=Saliniradius amylolyticus TaxID=2183582 RepID=A0A2S2E5F6_9ALTE|nr:hypothetical protein [Saliniradius amylolyticus]AWL12829.1 hypothetical protein HMF8227_02377 [Saliniradius amylolyticus]